jgi:hypothetical protein
MMGTVTMSIGFAGGDRMSDAIVGLADAIEALRVELTAAAASGNGQAMRFELEPIELTAQVAVTVEASGKIGWKILGLGGSRQSVATQTLTLRLTPWWKQPDGVLVRDFKIAALGTSGDTFGPHH